MATRTPLNAFSDQERALLEDVRRFGDRHNDLFVATAKGVGVLNSAGVAAMLAFMQALLNNAPTLVKFKPFGVAALIFFLVGAGASLAPLAYRMAVFDKLYRQDFSTGNPLAIGNKHATQWLVGAAACFALGASAAVAGVAWAL